MLYFNKLTGEHNAKQYFKKFLFCGNISLKAGSKFNGQYPPTFTMLMAVYLITAQGKYLDCPKVYKSKGLRQVKRSTSQKVPSQKVYKSKGGPQSKGPQSKDPQSKGPQSKVPKSKGPQVKRSLVKMATKIEC